MSSVADVSPLSFFEGAERVSLDEVPGERARALTLIRFLERLPVPPAMVPCVRGEKRPAVAWKDLRSGEQIPDRPDTTARGILTGARSGGIVVLDVDTKRDGFANFERLEAQLGALPKTLSVRTGSGGLHLYFRGEGFETNAGKLAPGVDVRGENGFLVAPGSVHPSTGADYEIEDDAPVVDLPSAWAGALARAGTKRASNVATPTALDVDAYVLRERLRDTCAGKGRGGGGKSAVWTAWRAVAQGDRFFDFNAPPGGVDSWISTELLSTLVLEPGWFEVSGASFAAFVDPAFDHLRRDAAALGTPSKWDRAHVAAKWEARREWAAGVLAEREREAAEGLALIEAGKAAIEAAKAEPLPLILQIANGYLVREETGTRYHGPEVAAALRGLCRELWGAAWPLEAPTKNGTRPMTAPEICDAYGRTIERLATEYTATTPRIDWPNLTLWRGPSRVHEIPAPRFDRDVAAWLDLLGGDQVAGLTCWIVWCDPARCETTVPALALVGGAHVGKSLLAHALAHAAGLRGATPLKSALGRFGATLANGPILFADEGLPRDDHGAPLTQEFRELITRKDHEVEQKGLDRRLNVHGAVRVVMAANEGSRLFSNRGNLGRNDVDALVRRLLVIEIEGAERIAACARAASSLGAFEGDPVRLARVAGHLRWVQATQADAAPPEPVAGSMLRELRAGGDVGRTALAALEDAAGSDWIAVDGPAGFVWVQPEPWARRIAGNVTAQSLGRALAPYIAKASEQRRTHPVTRASLDRRERWCALDLGRLRDDGVLVE